jgi:uncharacterized membrane protein
MPEASRFDFVERLARMRVPLGFFCAGAVLYLARPSLMSLVIGGAVAVAGEGIRVWAAGHLDKGREVTQSGPYRWMRHPLYVGSAIVALGAALAAANVGAALIVAAYMALTIGAAISHEEGNMRLRFGEQYDAYLRSSVAERGRPFSLHRALSINKEYKAIVGVALIALILALKVTLQGD